MANMNTNAPMAGSGGVNPSLMLLTPEQYLSLDPKDKAMLTRGLSPQTQAMIEGNAHRAVMLDHNRRFMRMTREKTGYCPVTGGSGTTAAYSPGTTLYFDFPTVPGFAKYMLIHYNLSVTPAAGTGATYAVTPAAPFNIFSELQVLYNGPQIRTHPYFMHILDVFNGWLRGSRWRPLAGNLDSSADAYLVGGTPAVVGSANTWQGTMILRLNALGEDTIPGLLPVSGTGNKPQLKLTCAGNGFIGQDPLLNPLAPVAGTGHAATVTGNINVDMVYLDGTTMANPSLLSLNWQQESTLQYFWDTALTPFNAGTIQRQTVSSKMKHWYMISIVIDGNQASAFAADSNFVGLELSPDQIGQQTFVNWGLSNNLSFYDMILTETRRNIGQDIQPGVIPWVAGPIRGVVDPSNRTGIQYLDMTSAGYPAATHSYQMSTVGGQSTIDGFAPATPRVETFLVSENPAGLRVA